MYTRDIPEVSLADYLHLWIECGKMLKTFEGFTNIFLRNQLLSIVGRWLNQFLKEKVVTNIKDMAKKADYFAKLMVDVRK